jgi:hypothetical protein
MTKIEVQQRVLQFGKPLSLELFSWDENTKVFSTDKDSLVIDFFDASDCTFKTGSYCTFKTGSNCTFDTDWGCTFKTGSNCTFDTEWNCTFDTGSDCTFKTGSDCTFKTGSNCTFKTGSDCVCIRRDVFEFFEIPAGKKIKLNTYNIRGFVEIQ